MSSRLWQQTGGIWPMGVSCSLTWLDFGAVVHILRNAGIRSVVEIGVEHGGLSAYLLACPVNYLGIDITLGSLDATLDPSVFSARDAWDAATVAEVGRWLAEHPAPSLIFCDGGDKPRELGLYAPLLRPGDVLIGHDYHNEYGDEALEDIPATRIQADWLEDTLICVFVRGAP